MMMTIRILQQYQNEISICSNITFVIFWADIARFLQYFRSLSNSFINILAILQDFNGIFLKYSLNITVLCGYRYDPFKKIKKLKNVRRKRYGFSKKKVKSEKFLRKALRLFKKKLKNWKMSSNSVMRFWKKAKNWKIFLKSVTILLKQKWKTEKCPEQVSRSFWKKVKNWKRSLKSHTALLTKTKKVKDDRKKRYGAF